MNPLIPSQGFVVLEEADSPDTTIIHMFGDVDIVEVVSYLHENFFNFTVTESAIVVEGDSYEDVLDEFTNSTLEQAGMLEYDELDEGTAKRKIVIRRGKRKVIFRCQPGQKKIGRRCIKRNGRDLMLMKRRAKRAARKARRKRATANRRRKMSMRRRTGSLAPKHKIKMAPPKAPKPHKPPKKHH